MASQKTKTATVSRTQDVVPPKQDAVPSRKKLESEEYVPQTMPQILNTWDMTSTFVVSIYLASCATTAVAGGPAAITYLVLVAVTFFGPCLIATMQLGVMFPYEGALYNWTHKALGGYWSFFSGFCAWFPGVLISASLADLFVSYIREMHSQWLALPWQEGLTICAILTVAGVISMQRFRVVQNLINWLVGLVFVGSLLVATAAVVWLLRGNSPVVNLSHWPDWQVKPDNYVMFGLIAFAYIGTEGPLNLIGEATGRHVIKRHLWWGALIIFIIYMTNTLSVLIVQGTSGAYDPFAIVRIVDNVLGHVAGSITAICFMGSFLATVLVYNYLYARLLMVASIDRHLPTGMGRLNKQRVPANAVIFQTVLAVLFTLLVFIGAPYLDLYGDRAALVVQVYNVSQAAAALIWAISAAFLFINLVACYLRDRKHFHLHRIFPMPILWISVVLGSVSCVLAIVDTLLFSWTSKISNAQWWYLVGGLTLVFLIVAGMSSMVANSEATWQDFQK